MFHNVQLQIIDILPDNEDEAMNCMCQIIANMILSMKNKSEDEVHKLIHKHLLDYNK